VCQRLVPLGEIVATHGVAGWLKLNPYNKQTNALTPAREIWLEKDRTRWTHEIAMSRAHKNQILLKLSGVDRIDDAQQRVGSVLYVAEGDLGSLAAGEYYHYQVIGLEVFDTTGELIGVVTRTWSTPAGELYVVAGAFKEHLIPAVREIIEKVDFVARKMIINPPEGLLDL
jgi:16S rRNA processing protein RimM